MRFCLCKLNTKLHLCGKCSWIYNVKCSDRFCRPTVIITYSRPQHASSFLKRDQRRKAQVQAKGYHLGEVRPEHFACLDLFPGHEAIHCYPKTGLSSLSADCLQTLHRIDNTLLKAYEFNA